MTQPDSLAAICAELRIASENLPVRDDLAWPAIRLHALADRIERLDAEMRKDLEFLRLGLDSVTTRENDVITDLRAQLAQARERLAELEERK